jgi:DNA-binding NtrC family response regulator
MKGTHRLLGETGALAGANLLVVEDDFLLRTEMVAMLQDASADAVHACRTIGEALATLDRFEVAAAILDVRVGRDSIAPVARKLVELRTPFLFYTGQINTDRAVSEWPDRVVLSKPAPARVIVGSLAGLLAGDRRAAAKVDRPRDDPSSTGE